LYVLGIPSIMVMTLPAAFLWGATPGYLLAGIKTARVWWRWLLRCAILGLATALAWHAISWVLPAATDRETALLQVMLFGLILLGHAAVMYMREWPGFLWDLAADSGANPAPEETEPEPEDNVSRMFLK